jgi:two-component system nitrogen regulation response regulator GlnG
MRQLSYSKNGSLITTDPILAELFQDVKNIFAPSTLDVLIQGETGAGKEGLAQAIHFHSPRAKGPFVALNCAAIPESLAESMLFGHVKGSFTGAVKDQKGCFEQASGGTVFLDEVASLSLDNQARLLRVLQQREVIRLGALKSIPVNVRVVAAANVDLLREVEVGRFRRDLYYRLAVAPLRLPPLRERRGDIELLARHFLETFGSRENETGLAFSSEVLALFTKHTWPGNVRELQNTVRYAVMMAEGRGASTIEIPHLPPEFSERPPVVTKAPAPQEIQPSGENQPQRLLIELLQQRSPRKIGELAAELDRDRSTVFKHLTAMEKAGLVHITRQRGRAGSLVSLVSAPQHPEHT